MKILIVKGDHHKGAIAEISEQLRTHGFNEKLGQVDACFESGDVTVTLMCRIGLGADTFDAAQTHMDSSKPDLLILDGRLDNAHRHSGWPKNNGGAALGAIALLKHECGKIICADTTVDRRILHRPMPEAILNAIPKVAKDLLAAKAETTKAHVESGRSGTRIKIKSMNLDYYRPKIEVTGNRTEIEIILGHLSILAVTPNVPAFSANPSSFPVAAK